MNRREMWTLDIYWLIGALILLAVAIVVLVFLWTVLRAWLWQKRQRHSQSKYYKQTHRADGRPYPPVAAGICEQCGRSRKKIYYTESGPKLCLECYEIFWRDEAMKEAMNNGS
ncbi:MAG: hypothetical protein JSV03_08755 [Planctomycetota bacterium]|nr:MAG: hypothetical protein JSV03_08755 [Planctomycetota bacterium]